MIKKINQNPTIADTILFNLETPGINGLLTADPTSIEHIVIYRIEQDFGKVNDQSYEVKHCDTALESAVANAKKLVQDSRASKQSTYADGARDARSS